VPVFHPAKGILSVEIRLVLATSSVHPRAKAKFQNSKNGRRFSPTDARADLLMSEFHRQKMKSDYCWWHALKTLLIFQQLMSEKTHNILSTVTSIEKSCYAIKGTYDSVTAANHCNHDSNVSG